jgi:hypothetical protein
MELKLKNSEQHRIADLLWVAEDQDEVNRILQVFGHNAQVVYNMMIAATFDEIEDVSAAKNLLAKYNLNNFKGL